MINQWEELGGSFQALRMHYKGVTCGSIQGEVLVGVDGHPLTQLDHLKGWRDQAQKCLDLLAQVEARWTSQDGCEVHVCPDVGEHEFRMDGFLVAAFYPVEALNGRCLKTVFRDWIAGTVGILELELWKARGICLQLRADEAALAARPKGVDLAKVTARRDQAIRTFLGRMSA